MSVSTRAKRCASIVRDDRGMALPMVMMVAAVLFVLATMIVALTVYRTDMVTHQTSRERAVAAADAGLNAYLYRLANVSGLTTSLAGSYEGVSWVVTATPPASGAPLTLRSRATLDDGISRIVVAQVKFPTFAEYAWLSNNDINVGSGATIYGKMHSNQDITNNGTITDRATAVGTCTGSGTWGSPTYIAPKSGARSISFAAVSTDMAEMKTLAQQNNPTTYWPALGSTGLGYEVILSGVSTTVYRVTASSGSGGTGGPTTKALIASVNVPANGVMYFDDDVWVQGTYDAGVTIVSGTRTIRPSGNLVAQDVSNHTKSLGLIAYNSVIMPASWSALPTNLTIQAAMLAQNGQITSENGSKASITLRGSMASYLTPSMTQGFTTRYYYYDNQLDFFPPPKYPSTGDKLHFRTWIER